MLKNKRRRKKNIKNKKILWIVEIILFLNHEITLVSIFINFNHSLYDDIYIKKMIIKMKKITILLPGNFIYGYYIKLSLKRVTPEKKNIQLIK
jgi:hypothetical protein